MGLFSAVKPVSRIIVHTRGIEGAATNRDMQREERAALHHLLATTTILGALAGASAVGLATLPRSRVTPATVLFAMAIPSGLYGVWRMHALTK